MPKWSNKNKTKSKKLGTCCSVPACENCSVLNRNVSWHNFPTDSVLRAIWISRVRREHNIKFRKWMPTTWAKVCGAHFDESGQRKKDQLIPTLNLDKVYTQEENDAALATWRSKNPSHGSTQISEPSTAERPNNTASAKSEDVTKLQNVIDDLKYENAFLQEKLEEEVKSNASDRMEHRREIYQMILDKNKVLDSMYYYKKKSEELDVKLREVEIQNEKLKSESQILNKKIVALSKEIFSAMNILDREDMLRYYTGFRNINKFNAFFDFVKESYDTTCQKKNPGRPMLFSEKEQLIIFLCRLRGGLDVEDLSYRFKASKSTISRICLFWTGFLSSLLKQVPIWLSKEAVVETMPEDVKKNYPNTRIVVDATEILIQVPSDFQVQSDTWSNYKTHNTAKGLIGIAPNSFVTFVSKLVPGRVSDRELFVQSGLLELLEEGDSVMADRGFTIEEDLKRKNIGLDIPAFLNGKTQLSAAEEIETRKIANFRINIERIIRDIRTFRIFQHIFPISMADQLDDIWHICAKLCNFIDEPLLLRKQ